MHCSPFSPGDSAHRFLQKRAFAFTNRLNSAKTGVRIKMQNVQEDTHEASGIVQPVDFSFSGFFSSIAVQALREVGRADGCGFSPGDSAIEGNLPAPIRHPGKTRAASPAGYRPLERALRIFTCRGAGVRSRFSEYYFRQIFEAKHEPGTVAYSMELQLKLLQETTDEMARNGCKKIIIVNGHGGNEHLLPFFAQAQLDKPHDYVVYVLDGERSRPGGPAKKSTGIDYHAGENETSNTLVSH